MKYFGIIDWSRLDTLPIFERRSTRAQSGVYDRRSAIDDQSSASKHLVAANADWCLAFSLCLVVFWVRSKPIFCTCRLVPRQDAPNHWCTKRFLFVSKFI